MPEPTPILNGPYDEPSRHYHTDADGSLDYTVIRDGRRMFVPDLQAMPSRQGPQGSLLSVNEFAADYDGSSFVARQVFFCGGPKDAFDKWRKGLDTLALRQAKRSLERTLKIEVDDEAFDRLYGFESHPVRVRGDGQRIAVRVVSQFGEESTKVLEVPHDA